MIKAHVAAPGAGSRVLMCGPPMMIQKAAKPALEALGFAADAMMAF